jgi:hypothetical protein
MRVPGRVGNTWRIVQRFSTSRRTEQQESARGQVPASAQRMYAALRVQDVRGSPFMNSRRVKPDMALLPVAPPACKTAPARSVCGSHAVIVAAAGALTVVASAQAISNQAGPGGCSLHCGISIRCMSVRGHVETKLTTRATARIWSLGPSRTDDLRHRLAVRERRGLKTSGHAASKVGPGELWAEPRLSPWSVHCRGSASWRRTP